MGTVLLRAARRVCLTTSIAALTATLGAGVLGAQARMSERGSASQTVDGTTITIDYGRPQLRGRTAFPGIVHWGEMWTPGANWATTLESNHPFKLGGRSVAAGKYSLWMVPQEKEWTIHLHRQPRLFHEAHPPADQMLLAVTVTPQAGEPTEVLTFDFPEVRRDGMTMQLRWGPVAVRVPVEVEPSDDGSHFTEKEAAPYVGTYTMISVGEKGDTTRDSIVVTRKDDRLIVFMGDEEAFIFVRAPAQPGTFYVAFVEKGTVVNVEDSSPVTITLSGGRATELLAHGARPGTIWFRAVRRE